MILNKQIRNIKSLWWPRKNEQSNKYLRFEDTIRVPLLQLNKQATDQCVYGLNFQCFSVQCAGGCAARLVQSTWAIRTRPDTSKRTLKIKLRRFRPCGTNRLEKVFQKHERWRKTIIAKRLKFLSVLFWKYKFYLKN